MAKKQKQQISLDELVDRCIKDIEHTYGEVTYSGVEVVNTPRTIIPISTTLDIITSGGFQSGSFIGITGPEKAGKSMLALSIAAQCQRPEYGERAVFYGMVEHRAVHFGGVKGLKLTQPHFTVYGSKEKKIVTAEEYLGMFEHSLKTVPGCVLIIDCISALVEATVLEAKGVGVSTRGGAAKLFSQFLDRVASVVPINDCLVIGITRQISNTSGYGPDKVEKVCNAWKNQTNYRLSVEKRVIWYADEGKKLGIRGQTAKWTCENSPLGPPGLRADAYLRYGLGYDKVYEAIIWGITCGVVNQSGTWLSLDWAGIKEQGKDNLWRAVQKRPDVAEELVGRVKAAAGLEKFETYKDETE